MAFEMSEHCGHRLYQIEYMRQHVLAGLGVPNNTIPCPNGACIHLGQPLHPCPRCVAGQTITIEAVEARLRDASGPSVDQPAQQAPTVQSLEARLRASSGPSHSQLAPRVPTWQEAQAENYLREERAFAVLDDEYDRIMADLRLREEQSRKIQEAEESSRRVVAGFDGKHSISNGFSGTTQTTELVPFVQGAGRSIIARHSRTHRYRDETRERRHPPSNLSQMVIAEEEEDVANGSNGDN
ncbi:MAG: hypothetical protein LQ347_000627 [Umbilicaria vellea]|nr:MAG: hypothetical protein LQ347_000627 [Umbilicaria vellea]